MSGLRIRPALPDDAEQVVAMTHDVSAVEALPPPSLDAERFKAHGFGADASFTCLVAEAQSRPIGHVIATKGFDVQAGRTVRWIADLYVHPGYRRRGVGTRLVAAMARLAQDEGASSLQWMIAPANQAARAFYRSIGARDDSGRPMYLSGSDLEALTARDDGWGARVSPTRSP